MRHKGVKTPAGKSSPVFLQQKIVSKNLGQEGLRDSINCQGNGPKSESLLPIKSLPVA